MLDHDPESVAQDMERLFRDITPSRARAGGGQLVLVPAKPPASGRRRLAFGAPVLVGTAAIVLAIGVGTRVAPTPHQQPGVARPSAFAAIMPAPPVPLRTADVGGARRAAVAPSVPSPPVARVQPVEENREQPGRQIAANLKAAATPPLERVVAARSEADPPVAAEACPPHSDTDDCIYRDVMQADRRLRDAYRLATDGGAPPRLIASVNRQWRAARAISLQAPDEAIRRYDALTRQLGGEPAEEAGW